MYSDNEIHVKIIGAGVSGLTTAITLLTMGFQSVEIYADKIHPEINSSIAAAIWVPYKVEPIDRAAHWCAISLKKFDELSNVSETGVTWINCSQVFNSENVDFDWMKLIKRVASPKYLTQAYKTVITNTIPLIDTTIYMLWLLKKFKSLGGVLTIKKVNCFEELYNANTIIINCSGLGARYLAQDENLRSVSGQIIVAECPSGLDYAIGYDEDPKKLTYIIPRKMSNTVIIGGTAIENDEDIATNITVANSVWQRATKLCPLLKTIDKSTIKHMKGFRPVRSEVRVESELLEETFPVIHNYGHGGGGFAISWGCADEVCRLVQKLKPTIQKFSRPRAKL